MEIPSFFRAYDIRGVVEYELTLEDYLSFGKAVGTVAEDFVVVGRDARVHGEICEKAFVSGVLSRGVDVRATGVVPIGVLSYAVEKLKAKIGVMVGASHNPPEYNGLKFFKEGGEYSKELDNKIRRIFIERKFKKFDWRKIGSYEILDIKNDYLSFVLSKVDVKKKIRVAVDCMNGAAGTIIKSLLEKLGCEYKIIHGEPSGLFPLGEPEPKPSKLKELMALVSKGNFDLGLAFDGDCDRVVVIDDKGRYTEPEKTASLIVSFLDTKPGDTIVASVNTSSIIDDVASEKGLKVIRTPVGHFYIIEAVKKHKAVLGFERSGHMTIPSLRLFDDAILVAAKLLEICSKLEEPLSKFFDKLPTYLSTEVSLECPDSIKFKVVEAISNELKAKFKKVDTIDGVKVYTDKGWFLIRASNTQPLIRITVEAKNEKNLQELLNYAKSLVARAQKHYMT